MVTPEWIKGFVNPEGKWNPKKRWSPMKIYEDYLHAQYPSPVNNAIEEAIKDDSVFEEFERHIAVMPKGALGKLDELLSRMENDETQSLRFGESLLVPREWEWTGELPAVEAVLTKILDSLEMIRVKAKRLSVQPVINVIQSKVEAIQIVRKMIQSRIETLNAETK